MEKDKPESYRPNNVVVTPDFYPLDTDIHQMMEEMRFNPVQELIRLYGRAADADEFTAAYNIGKYLSGYITPQAKQSEQKVVVQILHQGEPPKTLTENNVPIRLTSYKVLNEEEIKALTDDRTNTATVQLDA
jgi:2,4-dienoyl-CoA reductase-like NADH-dependent reductase (Old Yellow Enzyme family)